MSRAWRFGEVFVLRHAGFPFDWLESLGVSTEFKAAVDALLSAEADGKAGATEIEAIESLYRAERERLSRRLHELAQHPRVQEAVFLSSPDMFENVWIRYAARPCSRPNAASRRVERQVYAYLQRLCAKNETTSFFGPIGYGEIAGDDDAIEFLAVMPRRRTVLAYWAVEALSQTIANEREIWVSLPIRRNPLFRIAEAEREARCDSIDLRVPLSSEQLRFFTALPGCDQAAELAKKLGTDLEFVERVALSLLTTGVLVRRLWFRTDAFDTLGNLVEALEALPCSGARDRWLVQLGMLGGLCTQFQNGALDTRRSVLKEMERLFRELTDVPARRAGGKLYTDRLIVNEEASSSFRLRIGRLAAERLEAGFSPLLEISAAYGEKLQRAAIEAVCERLATSDLPVPFLAYAAALRELEITPPNQSIEVASASMPQQIARDLCGVASAGSRFALPDICLGRRADGSFHPVLARMHHHLLTPSWLFTFYSDPERAKRVATKWLEQDRSAAELVEFASGRHNKAYYTFPGPRVVHAPAEYLSREQPIYAAADLSVGIEARRPILRGPGGVRLRLYQPLSDLSLHPPFMALSDAPVVQAPILANAAHLPRLDVGDTTYQRERWKLPLHGWDKRAGVTLFLELQRYKRAVGLPRFLFARVPSERKPFLVDVDCPFAIELLRHLAREATEVSLEAMSPAPEELWLRDEHGRYTFELRVQATRASEAGPAQGEERVPQSSHVSPSPANTPSRAGSSTKPG